MDSFEDLVILHKKEKINSDILNSTWKHAEILFRHLLDLALNEKKDVRIISGNFNPDFYNGFADLIKKILKNNVVNVISLGSDEKNIVKNNNFLSELINSENGSIATLKGQRYSKTPHFLLVDKEAYRFEIDHSKTKAVANFNNFKFGELLYGLFEDIANSEDVNMIRQIKSC